MVIIVKKTVISLLLPRHLSTKEEKSFNTMYYEVPENRISILIDCGVKASPMSDYFAKCARFTIVILHLDDKIGEPEKALFYERD